jgi:hypothetical protein
METRETDQDENYRAALDEYYRAWGDMEDVIVRLQNAAEKVQQAQSVIAPVLAHDSHSWQVLDRYLYVEEQMMEVGQIMDTVSRSGDLPKSDRRLGGRRK